MKKHLDDTVLSTAIYDWVKDFGLEIYEKPKSQGDILVELDEMWHFLTAKKQTLDMESILSYFRSAHRLGMWKP